MTTNLAAALRKARATIVAAVSANIGLSDFAPSEHVTVKLIDAALAEYELADATEQFERVRELLQRQNNKQADKIQELHLEIGRLATANYNQRQELDELKAELVRRAIPLPGEPDEALSQEPVDVDELIRERDWYCLGYRRAMDELRSRGIPLPGEPLGENNAKP